LNPESFASLFSKALQIRDEFTPQMPSWFTHEAMKWPAVLGFGLPPAGAQVPLVTIGLNPSNREVQCGHISSTLDPQQQWEAQRNYFNQPRGQLDWFDKSDRFLQATIGRRHRDGTPHLDLSPQPTAGGFDGIYDKKATPAEKDVAREFLLRSVNTILIPLLDMLVTEHGLAKVVIYGYVPASKKSEQRGSITMKDFFWHADTPFSALQTAAVGDLKIARGRIQNRHMWLTNHPRLAKVEFVFLARGPSARSGTADLEAAANKIRELKWV
jgi:hypothetical protein